MRLGRAHEQDGADGEAVNTYEKILANNPAYAPAARRLALLYYRRDDAKAQELATRARLAYPEDDDVTKALGVLNYRQGLYSQSAELLKEAGDKRKDDAELQYYLGASYQQLKQWKECAEALRRALRTGLPPALADEAELALATCSEDSHL